MASKRINWVNVCDHHTANTHTRFGWEQKELVPPLWKMRTLNQFGRVNKMLAKFLLRRQCKLQDGIVGGIGHPNMPIRVDHNAIDDAHQIAVIEAAPKLQEFTILIKA